MNVRGDSMQFIRKNWMYLIIIVLFGGILLTVSINKEEAASNNYLLDKTLISEQEKIDEKMAKDSKEATFESPYIKLNPYGTAPLSAVAIFETEEPTKISLEVKGKTAETTIKTSNSSYKTKHHLSILGLYANKNNTVTITAETKDGMKATKVVSIQTKALPKDFTKLDVTKANTTKMEQTDSSLTFVVPSTKWVYGVDSAGEVRYYSTKYNSHVFKELKNGHLLYLTKYENNDDTYSLLLETDYVGKIYRAYKMKSDAESETSGSSQKSAIHHDAIELPSGNLLLTINDETKYMEDTMIEINRNTGEVVKEIDLKNILPAKFYKSFSARGDGKIDWFHQNAVVYDTSDDSIIISGRNQDTIMKLDYETGQIKWILSDDEGWPVNYQKYLLKSVDNDMKFPAGQHAPIVLPDQDNNDETVDILLYDNNVVVSRGDTRESKKYSQAIQYRINEKNKTIEEVWSYGKDRGEEYFTNIIGSARYMPMTGNRLVNFGYLAEGKESRIVEVDKNGKVVYELRLSDFPSSAWSYRAERFSLYSGNEE